MRRHTVRRAMLNSCAAVAILTVAAPAAAYAQEQTYSFNIPAQDLALALSAFGRQSHQQVVFDGAAVRGKTSSALMGSYTSLTGMRTLLGGTGFSARMGSKGEFLVRMGDTESETFTEQPRAVGGLIVTAQKREERLQDVPAPVTALSATALADAGHVQLRDYYNTVPGFTVVPNYEGNQLLSIRGVATGGAGNATVGVLIDDVPYGASAGNAVPDLDPGDLARVEVLRGPQGTLYGADSMGGLVKFVTVQPSTAGYSGRIEAGASSVQHGSQPGYDLRGSINVPISDTMAIRVSSFKRQDPGYIDNPLYHLEGVNEQEADGARIAGLWRPSSSFTLQLNAIYQNIRGFGLPHVIAAPGLGDLQQNYLPNTGQWDRTLEAYSATAVYKFGKAQLTSVTGYNLNRYAETIDFSSLIGALAQQYFNTPGAEFHNGNVNKKLTQEIRFETPVFDKIDLLAGAFYTDENYNGYQDYYALAGPGMAGFTPGSIVGSLGYYQGPTGYKEDAAFGSLTYHLTDRFDVQVGGRESWLKVTQGTGTDAGPVAGATFGGVSYSPPLQSTANAFTYLATARYKLRTDLMVYARAASGYRPGGPNSVVAVAEGAPASFAPDKTYNYEVGAKGDFLDHMVSIDASLYYINWKNIQLKLDTSQNVGFNGNGGNAKSEGVEFSVELRPWQGMSVSGWIAYDDAVITQAPTNAALYLVDGDRLAYSSPWSGSLSVEQDFPLRDRIVGFVGGQFAYVGDRMGIFTGVAGHPAPRQDYPAYTKTDLRAGVRYDGWTATVYANNVSNERGLVGGGLGFYPNFAFVYIQPRTVGLTVSKTFQ